MTAIHHEPTDPHPLPVVPVNAEAFDAIARTGGAVIELGRGGPDVVLLNGIEYAAVTQWTRRLFGDVRPMPSDDREVRR